MAGQVRSHSQEIYRWTEDDKLSYLIPRIEGQAAEFVYSQLPATMLTDYRELVREMNSRYRVIETPRSYAVQFSSEITEDYRERGRVCVRIEDALLTKPMDIEIGELEKKI